MVLDSFDQTEDLLIFKNTHDDKATGRPEKIRIQRTDPNAPRELYFVHIDVRDLKGLPSKELRTSNSNRTE